MRCIFRLFAAMFLRILRYNRQAALPLLTLLIFQCAGWFVAWEVARQEARWTMQQAMSASETGQIRVTLSMAEFYGQRLEDNEIRYMDRLYDVRYQEFSKDSVLLALCHDESEERLLNALGELLLPEDKSPAPCSPLRAWWAKWFGAVFLQPAETPGWTQVRKAGLAQHFPFLMPAEQIRPRCFTPPPET